MVFQPYNQKQRKQDKQNLKVSVISIHGKVMFLKISNKSSDIPIVYNHLILLSGRICLNEDRLFCLPPIKTPTSPQQRSPTHKQTLVVSPISRILH